jgi:hypothetical protein
LTNNKELVISPNLNNKITIEIDFSHEFMFQCGYLYWVVESFMQVVVQISLCQTRSFPHILLNQPIIPISLIGLWMIRKLYLAFLVMILTFLVVFKRIQNKLALGLISIMIFLYNIKDPSAKFSFQFLHLL